MAVPLELFNTPASSLNSFVAQCQHNIKEWEEGVVKAVRTVQKFLRKQHFQGDHGLDQKVLKVIQVGSFGNGTALRNLVEVELVMFLSSFSSFQKEASNYSHHEHVLSMLYKKLMDCPDLLHLQPQNLRLVHGVISAVAFTIRTWEVEEQVTVTIVPAYRVLSKGSSVPNFQPSPEVYVRLIEACPILGHFSPSFSELQRNFVKYKPTKLKSLLRLVKHWYLEYVKAQCPRAELPPMYALELLTIYAWETGTKESERFRLDKGLVTVLQLLIEYQRLCIYWTKYYTLQNPIIEDFVRNQLKEKRPIILDPADPTYNVATGYRWDIVAQSARCCLKQYCCYDIPNWKLKFARDVKVTVEQWGHVDFTIQVNPYESIQEFKEKIQCKLESSAPQRLSFQEPGGERQVLRNSSSLADYSIFSDTRVSLLQTFPPQMQVFVKSHSGGSHTYAIYGSSLVLDLKRQIEGREGLLRKKQQLELQGQALQDECSLSCYGVRDSTTLILSIKTVG
ncbi:2'-5'-oligoadenylate synthase-like protein isoform X1 [Cervus elaphus]|uniref:2'-5'-oligoadenylate synthase-like protein isoform X1 n=1 Tax=Cervus elaphus TaxID=9860 RepID=UPI001CC330AD|nr:2'-5'-oligoadenylate synthase-like protein isoform X1 [Cervus elaphus]